MIARDRKKSGYCLLFSQQAHISTVALPPVPRRLPPLPPPHLCRLPLHHPHWSNPSSQGPQSHDFFKESCSNLFLRPLGVLALRIKLPSTTCWRALQVNISVTNLSHNSSLIVAVWWPSWWPFFCWSRSAGSAGKG